MSGAYDASRAATSFTKRVKKRRGRFSRASEVYFEKRCLLPSNSLHTVMAAAKATKALKKFAEEKRLVDDLK